MTNQQQHPQAPALTLWVIWFSLTVSILIYILVLQMNGSNERAPQENDSFVRVLTIVAVVNFAASLIIRKVATSPVVKDGVNAQNFGKVLTGCILSWALAESIAIFGLIMGLTGYPMSTYGPFMLASFAAMVFLSPNFASLKGLVKVLPDEE